MVVTDKSNFTPDLCHEKKKKRKRKKKKDIAYDTEIAWSRIRHRPTYI